MTAQVLTAMVSALAAVVAASVSAYIAAGARRRAEEARSMRTELEECRRGRLRDRHTLELVIGAIVGLLPEPDRLALLRQVSEDTIDDVVATAAERN